MGSVSLVGKRSLLLLLILPFSCFLFSHTVPLLYGVGMSFHDWMGSFVGLENYKALFRDDAFRSSLKFSFIYALSTTILMTFLGLFIGIFVSSLKSTQSFLKSILLIPWAISLTAWGLLARIALNPQFGVVNYSLLKLGFIQRGLQWLGDPSLARLSVILAKVYKDVWFSALLFLAACQNIPQELYEEGKVDGATPWQALRYITIPLLRPAILYIGVVLFLFSLQEFDLIFALTGGGPGFATEIASISIYRQGIRYGNFEYGIATATLWSVIVSIFVITVFAPLQRRTIGR